MHDTGPVPHGEVRNSSLREEDSRDGLVMKHKRALGGGVHLT